MKRIAVAVMAACMLAAAVPAMSMQHEKMTQEEKDTCLLASKNCITEVDSIQKRIRKINAEIKKGSKVYSPAELKKLEQKLKEATEVLNALEKEAR